jgi:outer membrane protein assembly factor BamB
VLCLGSILAACVPPKEPAPEPPPPSQATDYSDGVIKLSASASLLDFFQPAEWRDDNAADRDLGSTNPVVVGNFVFAVGKQQNAFLLSSGNLGQQGGELARMALCFAIGGNATDGVNHVYVSCSSGVKQVVINASPPSMAVGWSAPVHANGPVALGDGLVWSVDTSGKVLYGLSPADGHVVVQHGLTFDGSVQHFQIPVIDSATHTVLVEVGNQIQAFPSNSNNPAKWSSANLDGLIMSAPVIVGSTVVAATEHDTLYGLKLSDGTSAWAQPRNVGTAVPLSVIHNLGANCGNIDPLGITSKLVVNGSTVFAVAEREQNPPGNTNPEHVLVAVDATNGNLTVGPTNIDPPGMNVPAQQQRTGLLAANGNVYVGFGGLIGDCGNYHGWVVAAKQDGSGLAGSFEVATASPSNYAAAVWAPGGLGVDGSGNVYAATGNSFNPPG